MGNSGSKNRTHPLAEQERRGQPMMTMDPDFDHPRPPPHHGPPPQYHGHPYDYDQRFDYDSGWHENRDYGQAYKHSREDPISKRSFTDCLCLLLFVAFLGGWGVVTFFAIQKGDISKVVYPTDTNGNICGRGALEDRKNLLMFDLTQCLNPAILVTGCQTTSICVKDCPTSTYSPLLASKTGKSTEAEIKKTMKPYCNVIDDVNFSGLNVVNSSGFNSLTVKELIDKDVCPPWYLPSSSFLGRCFPSFNTNTSADTRSSSSNVVVPGNETINNRAVTKSDLNTAIYKLGHFLSLQQFGERVFADLKETWWMIGVALIGACVLSFVWIVLMRFLASLMVWTSIVIVFLGSGSLLGFCGYKLYFAYLDTDPEALKNILQLNWTPAIVDDFLKQRDTWLAFTVITGIIFLVVVCVFIFLRQRILIAIALIEQGSRAVGNMCSSLFFPLLPWLMQLVVVGWALLVALYLASWGSHDYRVVIKNGTVVGDSNPCDRPNLPECKYEFNGTMVPYHTNETCTVQEFAKCAEKCPEASCQFVKYTHNQDYSWMQFTNLFGLYWGVFFFSAFGEMVLAGVFSQWYWTLDKKNDLPGCALGTAMYNATVFHLGTIAFGSLIISIIRMLRTILEYVEKKCKMYENDLTKCFLCMCKCCLWCLEKFMRFINRNAYIVCAIKSTNFCKSALEAFNLIMRNLVRVVVLDSVVDFLLFLGKLVIVLITGATTYVTFSGQFLEIEIPTLNYFFTPIVFITVGSYFIASAFFGVYAMAVDTLFLCFLEDLERNDGSMEKPYYMSTSLKQILGKMEKTAHENRRLRASQANYNY